MSGLEVIGGISAIIGIIDACIKAWKGVRKDLNFPKTFETVANQLPILRETLQICQDNLEPIKSTIPADAAEALLKTVESCKVRIEQLREIFESISGRYDKWYQRYREALRQPGKANRVEELMRFIIQDGQNLVNYHVVKSVTPDLYAKLEKIVTSNSGKN